MAGEGEKSKLDSSENSGQGSNKIRETEQNYPNQNKTDGLDSSVQEKKSLFDQEQDDDLAFDLTVIVNKIKNIFKSLVTEIKTESRPRKEITEKNLAEKTTSTLDFTTASSRQEDEDPINFSELRQKTKEFWRNLKGKRLRKEEIKKKRDKDDVEEALEESLDFTSTITFVKNNAHILVPILFIFIAVFVSTNLRMIPSSLPITDDWAAEQVTNFYRQQLETQINQQYPHLPKQNKNVLIDKEMQKLSQENKKIIENSIAQLSKEYKANFQDEKGETYLIEIDPYLWYSQARNILNHGHQGDKIIERTEEWYREPLNYLRYEDLDISKPFSVFTLRDGRLDKKTNFQLHPYVGAYLYKILSFFNGDLSLMRTMFILPAVLIGLSMIPIFLIGRKFAGNVGGLFAALFLAVNIPLLGRTTAGFSDNDSYSILMPLLISWLFLEAYTTDDKKRRWLLSLLSGFSVGVYAIAWTGWSSMFLFVLAVIGFSLLFAGIQDYVKSKEKLNLRFIHKEYFQKHAILFLGFLITSGLSVSLFQSFGRFYRGFTRPIRFIALKEVGVKSIWPNVLTTVAEFNTNSLSSIITHMGGSLLFWIALMGSVFLLFNSKKQRLFNLSYLAGSGIYYAVMLNLSSQLNNPIIFAVIISIPILIGIIKTIYFKEEINFAYPLLITVWIIGTAYAFTKGARFALLMAPAFALAMGSSLGFVFERVSQGLTRGTHLDKRISKVIVMTILALFLLSPFADAQSLAKNEIPLINDAWYNTLIKIKENSERAITTSWWDFGHWFAAITERMVTFDGGDQGERIYWVGKTLLTDNEAEAVGILRMLNCAQETAPHQLDRFTNDSLESIRILYQIFPIAGRDQAYQKYLELGLTEEQAAEMLDFTHCEDLIDNYFITSEDMVGKAGVWGHFGSWDFEKAMMYQNTHKLSPLKAVAYLTANFGLTEEQAEKIHQEIKNTKADRWIAPWPGYISRVRNCQSLSESEVRCSGSVQDTQVTFQINLNTLDVSMENNEQLKPDSLVYVTREEVIKKKLGGKNIGISLILLPEEEKYRFLLADPLQAAGMFTRLFFLEGHGLKCFKKFDDVNQITGGRIITWKVDYNCQQKNNYYFKVKEGGEEATTS